MKSAGKNRFVDHAPATAFAPDNAMVSVPQCARCQGARAVLLGGSYHSKWGVSTTELPNFGWFTLESPIVRNG